MNHGFTILTMITILYVIVFDFEIGTNISPLFPQSLSKKDNL